MGAITATITKVESSGGRARATGTLVLSSNYASGGDAIDPLALGLATVEDLFLGLPRKTDGTAVAALIFPVVRNVLPVRTGKFAGATSNILIQAFTDASTEASGDLSTYVIPYEAYGVGA